MNYVSSIVKPYGYPEKVKEDVATLRLIVAAQGSDLLLDVVAEMCGEYANKFKMSDDERHRVRTSVIDHLTNALCERV